MKRAYKRSDPTLWGHFVNHDNDVQLRNTAGQAVINWHTNNDNSVCQLPYSASNPVLYYATMTGGTKMFLSMTSLGKTTEKSATMSLSWTPGDAHIYVAGSEVNENFNGYIGEVIYYQRVLPPSEITTVVSYLQRKWGMISTTLASPSPAPVTSVAQVASIYATDATGAQKTSGFNPDARSDSLVVAFPGDSLSDVSHLINTSTNEKTLNTKSGRVVSKSSRFYGTSYDSRSANGQAGAILFSSLSSTNLFAGDMTVECWIRPYTAASNVTNAYFVCSRPYVHYEGSPTGQFTCGIEFGGTSPMWTAPGRFWMKNWGGTTTFGPYNANPNVWNHIAVTRSGTSFKAYVNGKLSVTLAAWAVTGGRALIMGGIRAPAFGDGYDDNDDAYANYQDFRVYTKCKYTGDFSLGTKR